LILTVVVLAVLLLVVADIVDNMVFTLCQSPKDATVT